MAKIGSMLPEISRHLFKKKATVLYPVERLQIPKDFRGKPICLMEKCSLKCRGLCAMDCPAKAIVIEESGEGAEKKKRLIFLLDRCLFCGQCAESCTFAAIAMTGEFELADYKREALASSQ